MISQDDEIEYFYDIGMRDGPPRVHFAAKQFLKARMASQLRMQDLKSDITA
ncbi:MAG TPA: hypothetical protein VN517_17850 [Terriglobales bacterium]|nr:hypothetical protein [Terriglobales bacterium]